MSQHVGAPTLTENENANTTTQSTEAAPASTVTTTKTATGGSEQGTDASRKRSRKPMRPRSVAWQFFEKFIDDNGDKKARCAFCAAEFFCDPKRNGTSSMIAYLDTCKKSPYKGDDRKQS